VHFLAYADASDGVTASTINTDFVDLNVQLLIQTLPTGYATKQYTPYKLAYQLATTVETVATVEGAVNLHVGGNQVDVQEGVVVREKVTPQQHSTTKDWFINEQGVSVLITDNPLKNKVDKIIKVYRNGIEDKKWYWVIGGTNGKGYVSCYAADYDSTAEYTVTYTLLDKYKSTAASNEVTLNYEANIATSLNHVIRRLGDVETTTTININAIAGLYKRVKALGG
jgi:hypothetical protein